MIKDITLRKVLAVIICLSFIILIFLSRSVFKPFILSIVLSYILYPLIKKLESIGIGKRISSLIVVVSILGIVILTAIYIIPGIIKELMGMINNFGDLENVLIKTMDFNAYNNLPEYLKEVINTSLSKLNGNISIYLNNIFENILLFAMKLPAYFLAPIFMYYFLSDKDFFQGKIKFFIPLNFREKALELASHVNRVIQGYFVSQVLLSLLVFVLTFISLLIIGIKFPLVIAIANGVANFIPYFGPIIGYVPALLIALTESGNKAVMVTIAFLIIQQVEANIIAPKIVSDCTGMHPVEVMVVLLVGGHFFGAVGMILSVPIAATIKISYKYIVRNMY